MNKRWMVLGAMACVGLTSGGAVAESETGSAIIRLSTGVEYASGAYGGDNDISEVYVPISVGISSARIGARLTVPHLSVDGPFAAPNVDGSVVDTGSVTQSGLGDIVASVTFYDVMQNPKHGLAVDLTCKVKFGTADASQGLGTGENDYSVLTDVYKFFDPIALVGTVGYKIRGEPAGISLDDVLLGSVGGLCTCSERSRIGLFYDYRGASLTNSDAVQELAIYGSRVLNSAWQLQYYAFRGFTDSGPDWGGGVQVGVNLPRYRLRDRD